MCQFDALEAKSSQILFQIFSKRNFFKGKHKNFQSLLVQTEASLKNGTLLDQYLSYTTSFNSASEKLETFESLSEKVKNWHKQGSNSLRYNASLACYHHVNNAANSSHYIERQVVQKCAIPVVTGLSSFLKIKFLYGTTVVKSTKGDGSTVTRRAMYDEIDLR